MSRVGAHVRGQDATLPYRVVWRQDRDVGAGLRACP
jgi:hypothetical protein